MEKKYSNSYKKQTCDEEGNPITGMRVIKHSNEILYQKSYYCSGNLISFSQWDMAGKEEKRIPFQKNWTIANRDSYKNKIINGTLTEEECKKIQIQFQNYFLQEPILKKSEIHLIAGVDIAYWKEKNIEYGVCCINITDFHTQKVIERVYEKGEIHFPYIPGFLAFRELPLVWKAAKKLKNQPDVYMFDGNGILHPRHMGLAVMASIFLEVPTLGVAKSYYKIGEEDFIMPKEMAGSTTDIRINGQLLGKVLRTHAGVKPVFVSVGNFMDLEQAIWIVQNLITKESRIPVPTREADLDTHKVRKQYLEQESDIEHVMKIKTIKK